MILEQFKKKILYIKYSAVSLDVSQCSFNIININYNPTNFAYSNREAHKFRYRVCLVKHTGLKHDQAN